MHDTLSLPHCSMQCYKYLVLLPTISRRGSYRQSNRAGTMKNTEEDIGRVLGSVILSRRVRGLTPSLSTSGEGRGEAFPCYISIASVFSSPPARSSFSKSID